jgi:hypothetical protein
LLQKFHNCPAGGGGWRGGIGCRHQFVSKVSP